MENEGTYQNILPTHAARAGGAHRESQDKSLPKS